MPPLWCCKTGSSLAGLFYTVGHLVLQGLPHSGVAKMSVQQSECIEPLATLNLECLQRQVALKHSLQQGINHHKSIHAGRLGSLGGSGFLLKHSFKLWPSGCMSNSPTSS